MEMNFRVDLSGNLPAGTQSGGLLSYNTRPYDAAVPVMYAFDKVEKRKRMQGVDLNLKTRIVQEVRRQMVGIAVDSKNHVVSRRARARDAAVVSPYAEG